MQFLFIHLLCFLLALYSTTLAQNASIDLLHTFSVPALADQFRFEQFGQNVTVLGDLNGDGFDDWAIGLPNGYNPETGLKTGIVNFYFGSSEISSNQLPDLVFAGNENDSHFGEYLCGTDVNGDSFSDLIVKQTVSSFPSVTKLVIFYGAETVDTVPDDYLEGGDDYYFIASAISPAGDVNNDGNDDLLINANHRDLGQLVYLLWGGDDLEIDNSMIIVAPEGDGYFGNTLSSAADINNDNFDDFLIGSPSYEQPSCYVYLGGEAPDSIAYTRITGPQNSLLSWSMSPAGNINNDGFNDFMVAAPNAPGGGEVRIFYGGDSIGNIADLTLNWGTNRFLLGNTMLPLADINNDGYDEVLVSVEFGPQFGVRETQVHLYYSPALTDIVPDVIFNPHNEGDGFGASISAGDIDADSDIDILIGANGISDFHNPGFSTGYISVFLGGGSIDNFEDNVFDTGSDAYHFFGEQVESFDMNNDSLPEVIISAPENSTGVVYIYQGSMTPDNFPEFAIYGLNEDDQMGYYMAPAGDLNNDQYQDLIISYSNGAIVILGGADLNVAIDLQLAADNNSLPFVSSAGDLNNDGYDDIIMASELDEGTRIFIFYGGEPLNNTVDITEDIPGYSPVSRPAGDLNGDGFDDILMQIWDNSANVLLFNGGVSMDFQADITYAEELQESENYGIDFEVADISGDGNTDLVIISEYETGGGRFFVYLGDSSGIDTLVDAERELASGARSVTLQSDLNSDHINDIVIGTGSEVEIFFGGTLLSDSADLILKRGGQYDDFGNSVSSIAGRGILVGAPRIAIDGPNMGQAFVYGDDSLYTIVINSLETSGYLPQDLQLYQNFPNPFNPQTTIRYYLAVSSKVELSIYNILGQKINTLVNEKQKAGMHYVGFNAEDLASGVYFYRLEMDNSIVLTKKLVVIK